MSKSKRTPAFIEDSDEELEDEKPSSKKSKKSAVKKPKQEDSEEEEKELLPLSNKRFVSVGAFHGKIMVNIREYYNDQDTGELKPGRKGISLSLDQWEKLKSLMPKIDSRVKNMS